VLFVIFVSICWCDYSKTLFNLCNGSATHFRGPVWNRKPNFLMMALLFVLTQTYWHILIKKTRKNNSRWPFILKRERSLVVVAYASRLNEELIFSPVRLKSTWHADCSSLVKVLQLKKNFRCAVRAQKVTINTSSKFVWVMWGKDTKIRKCRFCCFCHATYHVIGNNQCEKCGVIF